MKPDKSGWYWWKGSDQDIWIPVQVSRNDNVLQCYWEGIGASSKNVQDMHGEFGGYIPYQAVNG